MKRKYLKVGQPVWVVRRPSSLGTSGLAGRWVLEVGGMRDQLYNRARGILINDVKSDAPLVQLFNASGAATGKWFVNVRDLKVRHAP